MNSFLSIGAYPLLDDIKIQVINVFDLLLTIDMMSLKMPHSSESNLQAFDPLHNSNTNKDENDSEQESLDGLNFGYQNAQFYEGMMMQTH